MNLGVFENANGNVEQALQIWKDAEYHLFDQYIRKVGPTADLEFTGKTINLWQNIMSAALDSGDGETAAEMSINALRLHSYWDAHDLETPDLMNDALGDFLGDIHYRDEQQRTILISHLPEEIAEVVESLVGDDGEEEDE